MSQLFTLLERRAFLRHHVTSHIPADIKLFGSTRKVICMAYDISEHEILLIPDSQVKTAFNSQSILEVWMRFTEEAEVYFIAKFIRLTSEGMIAISITEMDKKNHKIYVDHICRLIDHEAPKE